MSDSAYSKLGIHRWMLRDSIRNEAYRRALSLVVKPGHVFRVETRLDSAHARVTEIRLNAWGVLDALHKFTGVRMDQPDRRREWILTRIWSFAMDALAVGLVILVCSGLYLWYRLPAKRATGLAALVVGVACCAFFLYGWGTGMT